MIKRCENVSEIVQEANRILFKEHNVIEDNNAEYFFRGESLNHKRKSEGTNLPLDTDFPSYIDRSPKYYENERQMYQEALRLNIISFERDTGMIDRIARMQHFQLPTRFCDITSNVLVATMFACGAGNMYKRERNNGHDGYVRIIKVRKDRIKSFTSDRIIAIAHLPLVDADKIKPSQPNGLDSLAYEVKNSRSGFWSENEWKEIGNDLRNDIQHVWGFKPILNSERVRSQSGLFLAFGCRDNKQPLNPSFSLADYNRPEAPSYGIAQVGYIQINGQFKDKICEEMRYFGVPAEGIYPDLSNVSIEISERLLKKGKI